jgi:uroporphyrinogen III methyltransferase/synthase
VTPASGAYAGPLFGKRVLVTRTGRGAETFAQTLAARGARAILAPTIAIRPPDDLLAAHRAIDELSSYDWLVFTSANAVDAFFDRLHSLDADARYLGGIRLAAIGTKTAERLAGNGLRTDIVPAAFVGEEIARALIEAARLGDRVLIYCAQGARDVLPTMLANAGLKPTVVAAYRTVTLNDPAYAAKALQADALTFTSASTVRGFVELLGGDVRALEAARGRVVACIGPVTAQAARDAGLQVDVIADTFTADGLADALEAHFARTAS